jgi:hypothetical protein
MLYLSRTSVQQPGFQRCSGFIAAGVARLFIFRNPVIPRTNPLITFFPACWKSVSLGATFAGYVQ